MDGKRKRLEDPITHITINRSAMFEIKDRANKIYQQTLRPDAVLIMFQALKDYMEKRGVAANFSVPGEGKKDE